jgi:uncharacterized protein (TIGR02265 family)
MSSFPSERLVRVSALEGLLRGLDLSPGTPAWRDAAVVVGGTQGVLPATVPVERYVELMRWGARTFFSNLSPSKGLFEVGCRLFSGYRKTLLGSLQLAALPVLGVHRFVLKAPELFRRNAPFGERTVKQQGAAHYRIEFRGIPIPADFYCGAMTSGLQIAGAGGGASVKARVLGPEDVDYELSWTER